MIIHSLLKKALNLIFLKREDFFMLIILWFDVITIRAKEIENSMSHMESLLSEHTNNFKISG